jgi:hypothetical protein
MHEPAHHYMVGRLFVIDNSYGMSYHIWYEKGDTDGDIFCFRSQKTAF